MRRAAAAWVLGLLLAAAAGGTPAVPRPDLATVEPTLRGWLERAQAEVAALVAAGAPQAGAALGDLGRIYHVFGLEESAAEAYAGALELEPGEFRWTYLQAVLAHENAKAEEAEAGMRRALELAPQAPAVLLRLGDLLLDRGQPEEARALYETVLAGDPDSAAALYGLGRALVALGDQAAAAQRFERALALQPEASAIHYPLAQVYRRLGREADSTRQLARRGPKPPSSPDPVMDELEDFKNLVALQVTTALAADPGGLALDEVLGFALAHLGKVEGVVPPLLEVIAQRHAAGAGAEELARLEYLAGGFLVRKNRDGEAVARFRAALEHQPSLAAAAVALGNALARMGRWSEAAEAFARLLERDPDDGEALLKRATARLNLGDLEAARADLERLLEHEPRHAAALARMAEVLDRSGDPARALTTYQAALAAAPSDEQKATVSEGLCGFHQRRGRLAEAVAACREGSGRDPARQSLRLSLAALLGATGGYEEAMEQYRQVLADEPAHEGARAGEVAALLMLERYAEALPALEKGLAALPESALLRHLLARLLAAAPDATVRDGRRALELAQDLHRAAPTTAVAETVAMAHAELGEFAQAASWQVRAQADGAATSERLQLYRGGRPYRARAPQDLLVPPPQKN
jgi:tetratricopeptide (TPR) repeat protein